MLDLLNTAAELGPLGTVVLVVVGVWKAVSDYVARRDSTFEALKKENRELEAELDRERRTRRGAEDELGRVADEFRRHLNWCQDPNAPRPTFAPRGDGGPAAA